MFDDGEHACQNDTNIIIHFFGSLCSLFSVTSIKVTEKVYTRAAVKEIFNHRLLVILSEVNGTSFLLYGIDTGRSKKAKWTHAVISKKTTFLCRKNYIWI